MFTLLRLGAVLSLLFGLIILVDHPESFGQDKKDDKEKEKLYEDVGCLASDGVEIRGQFYKSKKNNSDVIIMMPEPRPGNSFTKGEWVSLAEDLYKKGYSVLLFDWRGIGKSGPEARGALISDPANFRNEPYNRKYILNNGLLDVDKVKLDFAKFPNDYKEKFIINDLAAVKRFVDSRNNAKEVNSSRTWFISEGKGAGLALAFITTEFRRNTVKPKDDRGALEIFDPLKPPPEFYPAGKDYAGLIALSYNISPMSKSILDKGVLNLKSAKVGEYKFSPYEHFKFDFPILLIQGENKDGLSGTVGSALLDQFVNRKERDEKLKYIRIIKDSKDLTGGALLDKNNTLETKAKIMQFLESCEKKNPGGKDPKEKDVRASTVPRVPLELYGIVP
ncbi:MAG: hypothetical protein N2112_08040 [Gemmataceae bacterium]|jgi:hypothetical protein|nr:hypothetical protein [Gemmataceae bacterium]